MEERSRASVTVNTRSSVVAPRQYLVNNVIRKTQLASLMEVAGTGSTRSKGLLGRKSLEPGQALWIVPCEAVHTFWMQFDIDLVYIDRQNRVRKVKSSVPPWRLSACFRAHSVIELPAGVVRQTQTQPGDVLEFVPVAVQNDDALGEN